MVKYIALVRCEDTTDLDFEGRYFIIRGWKDGYLKIQDDDIACRLPETNEGSPITKFESTYDLMKFVREHEG